MFGTTRTEISDTLKTTLDAIGSVEARVVVGSPVPELMLPNITFKIEEEALDPVRSYMGSDTREVRITIEGRALIEDGSDSPIDDLCLEIESSIATASTLSALCQDLRIESTSIELEEDSIPIGLAILSYIGYYEDLGEDVPVWVEPTVMFWSVYGLDNGDTNAIMMFQNCVTNGNPCQVKWRLVWNGIIYDTKYSSPEQNSPHAVNVTIVNPSHRGRTYDLYWSWKTQDSTSDWQLIATNAVYVPRSGDGDIESKTI